MAHRRRSIHPYWVNVRTKRPHYAWWCETVKFRVLKEHREETDAKWGWTHLSPVWHSTWWVPALLWEISIWLLSCYNKQLLLWFSQSTESPYTCINNYFTLLLVRPSSITRRVLVMPSSCPVTQLHSAFPPVPFLCSFLYVHSPLF